MENNEKSWWARNWIWVVPSGGCLILIVIGVIVIGGLIVGASKIMTSSEPYKVALEESMNNELLKEAIGDPIVTDGSIQGNINYSNGVGNVNLKVPVKGSEGKAVIEVKGEKEADVWEYEYIRAIIETSGDTLDFMKPDSKGL